MTLRPFDRGHHDSILSENEEAYFAAVEKFLARVAAELGPAR